VASVVRLQAKQSQFLAASDGLIRGTALPCVYISRSRSGRFRVEASDFHADDTVTLSAHARGVLGARARAVDYIELDLQFMI
jgi:hypothetical protein